VSLKVADRWFERRSLADGITLLWEPHVHPVLRCNIWHVRGRDRDLLIDTGLGVASLREAAKDLFEKNLLTVATHSHLDHMGGLHEFDCRLCHPLESELFGTPDSSLRLVLREEHWLSDYIDDLDESRLLIDALPHAGFDPHSWRLQGANPTGFLEEGSVIDLGNRAFEILHLPGHSPGSIGLFELNTGILFSGDALYDDVLLANIPGASIPQYIYTLTRLRQLPLNLVHGGHDKSFGRERLMEITQSYLELWNRPGG